MPDRADPADSAAKLAVPEAKQRVRVDPDTLPDQGHRLMQQNPDPLSWPQQAPADTFLGAGIVIILSDNQTLRQSWGDSLQTCPR